ncbi:MAG TPA: glycosyltransferase family 39 protein, partial [Myxococcales bacterium]|nr:glycosyltransferase family 39 protein [Myxococcales bacterium]
TWSRHLASGYFDHPPLVAWLIRLLGVRGCALACGAATIALVQGLAADVTGRPEAGWRAAALWSVLPASVLAGVFATPDAPLMVFWVGSLWALHRRRFALAGALAGLALLSKYTGALLAAPAAVAWLQAKGRVRSLLAGVAAAALAFAPALAWNATHDWASFRFQLTHGLHGLMGDPGEATAAVAGRRFLEFAGGQRAMGGLVLPLGLWWAVRERGAPLWLRWAFLVPVAVFAAASLFAPGQANWASVAYLAPCAWIAAEKRWPSRAAAVVGAAVCLGGLLHLTFPVVRLSTDAALARTHGWRELRSLHPQGAQVAYAPNFGLASEIAYQSQLPVAIAGPSRLTQFDFWPEPQVEEGGDALFVSEGDDPPEKLIRAFTSVEGPEVLETGLRGQVLHRFQLWRLRGKRAPPDRERPPLTAHSPPD